MKIKIFSFVLKNKNFSVLICVFFAFVVFLILNLINFCELNNQIQILKISKNQFSKNYFELMKKFNFYVNENKKLEKKCEEKRNLIQNIKNNQEIIENEILNITNSINEIKEKNKNFE